MNKKIIILQGCPCSGKSTWARQFKQEQESLSNDEKWEIISRDTIRYQIGNGKYTLKHEKEVTEIENSSLERCVSEGYNIIIDATNLNPKTIERWKTFSRVYNYDIEFKEFYVPYNEAMRRSVQRKNDGGLYISKKVMLDFYNRYYKERLEDELRDKRIIRQPENLKPAIICDLDGTLALHTGRTPFDWSRINEDKIDPRLNKLLKQMSMVNAKIFFVTGRNDSARPATLKWLEDNFELSTKDYELVTRRDSDYRSSDVYKREVYKQQIENKYDVICVFEDSNKCVDMWRSEGLLTCQVHNSDY